MPRARRGGRSSRSQRGRESRRSEQASDRALRSRQGSVGISRRGVGRASCGRPGAAAGFRDVSVSEQRPQRLMRPGGRTPGFTTCDRILRLGSARAFGLVPTRKGDQSNGVHLIACHLETQRQPVTAVMLPGPTSTRWRLVADKMPAKRLYSRPRAGTIVDLGPPPLPPVKAVMGAISGGIAWRPLQFARLKKHPDGRWLVAENRPHLR